ncbi:hypothetical protein NESM_000878900 [Novymonas esmeraldas]|uniref:Zinc finger PHD-type domain-containing protein n=1 Tax=Novymonas esmeraldas TaxID=1808958 RepID=A0AAW0F0I4_9TRYP
MLCDERGAVCVSADAFYRHCTVCGKELEDIPTIACDACGSRTHITCARDVYSNEWLYDEVALPAATSGGASVSGGGGGSSSGARPPRTTAASAKHRWSPGAAPATESDGACAAAATARTAVHSGHPLHSPPLSRDASHTSLPLPSPQALRSAAARIDKTYHYYCHPDCAMGMEVMRNPHFDPAVSRNVERAFTREWNRALESLVSAGVLQRHARACSGIDNDGAGGEAAVMEPSLPVLSTTVTTPVTATCALPGSGTRQPDGAPIADTEGCHPAIAQEVSRLYHQLRAEAWAEYYEQERHHVGHPLFYAPPYLDIARDAAVGHVMEAASPQGQAARLYLLDPRTHPAGSAVAVPRGVLARWQHPPTAAPRIKENDSNNFVAESLQRIVGGAETPETVMVYRRCGKEGRVLARRDAD